MEQMQQPCPYCGGREFVKGKQAGHGSVIPYRGVLMLGSQKLVHLICRGCGTVARSYIENPQAMD